MDSSSAANESSAPTASTYGAVISEAATEIGIQEAANGQHGTPLARRLIGAGVAFEQLLAVALLAKAVTLPGGTRDITLMADLRKALAQAEPVLAKEHYTRLARQAQKVAA